MTNKSNAGEGHSTGTGRPAGPAVPRFVQRGLMFLIIGAIGFVVVSNRSTSKDAGIILSSQLVPTQSAITGEHRGPRFDSSDRPTASAHLSTGVEQQERPPTAYRAPGARNLEQERPRGHDTGRLLRLRDAAAAAGGNSGEAAVVSAPRPAAIRTSVEAAELQQKNAADPHENERRPSFRDEGRSLRMGKEAVGTGSSYAHGGSARPPAKKGTAPVEAVEHTDAAATVRVSAVKAVTQLKMTVNSDVEDSPPSTVTGIDADLSMLRGPAPSDEVVVPPPPPADVGPPPLTIYTIPRGTSSPRTLVNEELALRNWLALKPTPEVVLIGEDSTNGVKEIAERFGVKYIELDPATDFAVHPTLGDRAPSMSGIFRRGEEAATSNLLTFVNADILLSSNYVRTILAVREAFYPKDVDRTLITGVRTDCQNKPTPTWNEARVARLLQRNVTDERVVREYLRYCVPHGVNGYDYLAYSKGMWGGVTPAFPPFAVGLFHWDDWAAIAANKYGSLIDTSPVITAVHLNHDYPGGKSTRRMGQVPLSVVNHAMKKKWFFKNQQWKDYERYPAKTKLYDYIVRPDPPADGKECARMKMMPKKTISRKKPVRVKYLDLNIERVPRQDIDLATLD